MQEVRHTIAPVFDADSRLLILGTMPSPRSRAEGFYYAHPQNRFWPLISALFQSDPLTTVEQKIFFLKQHRIAMWDVLASCTIHGAADSTIKDPQPNDIASLIAQSKIEFVFTLGNKAYELYEKHVYPQTGLHATVLPSPSSANAVYSFDRLLEKYRVIPERLRR